MQGQQVQCILCDKTEEQCECERYCCLCRGQYGIRLCMDGQYYCPECREACDINLASSDLH